jgi:hypothetical protein
LSFRVIWQYMDRSIYCQMTLSAMNYLLFMVLTPISEKCLCQNWLKECFLYKYVHSCFPDWQSDDVSLWWPRNSDSYKVPDIIPCLHFTQISLLFWEVLLYNVLGICSLQSELSIIFSFPCRLYILCTLLYWLNI